MKIAGVIFSIIGIIAGIFMFFMPWFLASPEDVEFLLDLEINTIFVVIENDMGLAILVYLLLFLLAFTLLIGILGIIYSSKEHRSNGVYIFIIISGVLMLIFSGFQGIFFIIVGILGIKNIKKMFKTCPFCRNLIKKEAIICQFCGKDLSKEEERKALPNTDNTKKCPFCSNEIKKEAIVCQFCGKDLPKEEEKALPKVEIVEKGEIVKCKKCKKCGKNVAIDYTSCPYCGSSFEENRKEQTIVLPRTQEGKKCKRCGQMVDLDIFKCPNCKCKEFN